MKRLVLYLVLFSILTPVYADIKVEKAALMPEGVYRRTANGSIVQYNTKGKKIGVYKIKNGKYVKIK